MTFIIYHLSFIILNLKAEAEAGVKFAKFV